MDWLKPLTDKLATEAGLAVVILSLAVIGVASALKIVYDKKEAQAEANQKRIDEINKENAASLRDMSDKYVEIATALQIALNNNTNVIDRLREKIEG